MTSLKSDNSFLLLAQPTCPERNPSPDECPLLNFSCNLSICFAYGWVALSREIITIHNWPTALPIGKEESPCLSKSYLLYGYRHVCADRERKGWHYF